MDPLTLAVAGVAAAAIFLIAIGIATSGQGGIQDMLASSAAPRDIARADLKIKTNELVLRCLSTVGIPLLMIVLSVSVPWLRNPLFLIIGAFVGFLLPGFWLSGSKFGRTALVAGLLLAAVFAVLAVLFDVLVLQSA